MAAPRVSAADLCGKVIDCHAHVGMSTKCYASVEYPYGQTLEGLYYRQLAAGVDVNVVFPYSAELFFDAQALVNEGRATPAENPLSPAPYATENRMLLAEVYDFCPEIQDRFLPFISVDPERAVSEQLKALEQLTEHHAIYGIKIVPVACQSSITGLLRGGRAFVDFARERDLPFLLHTTYDPREGYSTASETFRVIEAYPDLRVCLAHCIGFTRKYLDRAAERPNVWVDTAAMKIQVQLAHEGSAVMAPPGARFPADYSDYIQVTQALVEAYPDTIIWGTDSPAYSYICRRQQAEGVIEEFRLKATYEDEKAALDALTPEQRSRACNTNTLRWLFGNGG